MRTHSFTTPVKGLALLLCLGLCGGLMAGCSAGGSSSSAAADTLYIAFVGTYVDDTKLEAFAQSLRDAMPALTAEGKKIEVTGVSVGDTDTDPMGAMAGITRATALLATGEADLVIADYANGARMARSDAFAPLSGLKNLLVPEDRKITFAQLDDNGDETGDMLAECGVDLSDNNTLRELMPANEIGAYVVDTAKKDAAVDVINHLLSGLGG